MKRPENFIHNSLPESDIELFFGNNELENTEKFTDGETIAHLLVKLGKFTSLTQARKNGFDKPIPDGFCEHKVGKTRFWTLNKFKEVSGGNK